MKSKNPIFAMIVAIIIICESALTFAGGRRLHLVTVTGQVRPLLVVGYENYAPFDRIHSASPLGGVGTAVVGNRMRLEASPHANFSEIVFSQDVDIPDVWVGSNCLPQPMPHFDGVINFGGTSGVILIEPGPYVPVKIQFLSTETQLFWRGDLLPTAVTPSISGNVFERIETGELVDFSQVTIHVGASGIN